MTERKRRRPTRITPAMAAHAATLAAANRTAADIARVLGCSENGALSAIRRGGGTPAGPGRRPTPVPGAVADALVLAYAAERSLVRAVAAVNAGIGADVPQLTTSIARRVLQDRGVPLGAPRRAPAGAQ